MHDREVVLKAPVVAMEQRRAERVLYRDLKICYDGCTDSVRVRSPDLNPNGIFINTPRIFPKGAELRLRFDLLRTAVTVLARGQVRYCLPGVGVGVQFVGLLESPRSAIEKELEIIKKEEARMENKKTKWRS